MRGKIQNTLLLKEKLIAISLVITYKRLKLTSPKNGDGQTDVRTKGSYRDATASKNKSFFTLKEGNVDINNLNIIGNFRIYQ